MAVEFLLGLSIWGTLAVGLILVGRVMLVQQRAHRIARYGTLLQSTGRVDEAIVRSEIADYAARVSINRISWQFKTGRFLGTPSAGFYRLVFSNVTATLDGIPRPVTSTVVCQQEAISS